MTEHDDILVEFGSRVRTLRRMKGLSQIGLSEAVGYSKSTIQRIELGESNTSVMALYCLAESLGVDVTDLLPKVRVN